MQLGKLTQVRLGRVPVRGDGGVAVAVAVALRGGVHAGDVLGVSQPEDAVKRL